VPFLSLSALTLEKKKEKMPGQSGVFKEYLKKIGVEFALKVINWDDETVVRLQLWDIAGQERFGNMTRVYYKEAVGAFIVFDVTRPSTLDGVRKWKADIDSKVTLPDGSVVPVVLLANKCDLPKRGLVASAEEMDKFCEEYGFVGWFETSAKENINIDKGARFLVSKVLENDQSNPIFESHMSDAELIDIGKESKSSSCCG